MSAFECPVCNEQLISGDAFIATENGKKFHDYCFKCVACKTVLDQQPYYLVDEDQLYCKDDFYNKKLPRCNTCGKPIDEPEYERFGDKCFHIEHFNCDSCGKQITDPKVVVIGKSKFCYKDAQAKGISFCQKCFQPIQDIVTKAGDKTYHSSCLECGRCHKQIEGVKSLLEFQGEFYHEDCLDENMIKEMQRVHGKDAVKGLKLS